MWRLITNVWHRQNIYLTLMIKKYKDKIMSTLWSLHLVDWGNGKRRIFQDYPSKIYWNLFVHAVNLHLRLPSELSSNSRALYFFLTRSFFVSSCLATLNGKGLVWPHQSTSLTGGGGESRLVEAARQEAEKSIRTNLAEKRERRRDWSPAGEVTRTQSAIGFRPQRIFRSLFLPELSGNRKHPTART